MNGETRNCQNCKSPFVIEPDDFSFYEKIKVPPPTFCPQCRLERRMILRNFKTLYKRNSDRSQKSILSMYAPSVPYKVFTHEEWWADDWDPKSYGKNFDASRPFFDQLKELLQAVPRFALMNNQSVNCEYSNFTFRSKNCYLIFGCVEDEECAYGHIVWESKDSLDNLYLHKSELCYECVDCLGCFNLKYSQECESCTDSIGLYDCRSCTHCIGSVGLKQKSYYVFNEHVGKDGYEKFLADHPLTNPASLKFILERQEELRRQVPQRYFFGSHNSDVSGNHIYNGKNIHYSFDVKGGENSKYIYTSRKALDSYDCSFSPDIELSYEILTCLNSNRVHFSHLCQNCSDTEYSDTCFTSQNIFGCVGLRNAEYCILNKQYDRESFEKLRTQIIEHMKKTGEWGEFFPTSFSPFAYNESIINEYLPLTKEEATAKGFRWSDEIPHTVGQETISNNDLPQKPDEFSSDLLKHILKCDKCSYNFRLIPQEIDFYKKMKLPLPRLCSNCRHEKRMRLRNARKLWDGKCARCNKELRTTYSPEQQKKFRIYCEQCYQAEVV